ncbi:winged helix-turn-helix domain-containing protein [Paenibacillus sp. TC-CSREp1]|uniref:winged helix-turn-helix domain-containing protein n=1 Tax=Paenibacillus sp. TC-CSREp1 TaxID=3410089 RepID=UPI003D011E58
MSILIWKDYSVMYTPEINKILLESGEFIIVSDIHSFLSVDHSYVRCIILDSPSFTKTDFIYFRKNVKLGINIIIVDHEWDKELHNLFRKLCYQLKERDVIFNEFTSTTFCCEELIQINPTNRSITIKGNTEIEMTKKEFNLFYFLFQNKGKLVNTEEIIKGVWAGVTSEANVYMTIQKIRNKVEINPKSPKYLITKKGGGYMFKVPKTNLG